MATRMIRKDRGSRESSRFPSLLSVALTMFLTSFFLPVISLAFISGHDMSVNIRQGLRAFIARRDLPTSNERLVEFTQRGSVDCGPAGLAYVLNFFGLDRNQEDIKKAISMTTKGTSMAELARFARSAGFEAWGESQNLKRLETVTKPVIAFIGQNHFVVVLRTDSGGVVYFDPSAADSLKRMRPDDFLKSWHGEVLRVLPKPLVFTSGGSHENPAL